MKYRYLIGIDEAGRGPIAGPVAVGAVVIDLRRLKNYRRLLRGLKDSKQLSPAQRELWFSRLEELSGDGLLDFAVSFVGNQIIDQRGIVRAVRLAVSRSLSKLELSPASSLVLLDGTLTAPGRFVFQKTIIRGDETEPIIALASVAAKVVRDRKMLFWAKRYPDYGFAQHKGYGTKKHYHALLKYGPTSLHRLTFLTPAVWRFDKKYLIC